ncbi:hypothetical protein B0T09DRAFT_326476 [Sordaria sp. MPI-SDFR-AT-0083]|nr:hypothetical protein B0T09DRAFT_326476 [Sordaria sp. MPI-SDFR-AT-0083]
MRSPPLTSHITSPLGSGRHVEVGHKVLVFAAVLPVAVPVSVRFRVTTRNLKRRSFNERKMDEFAGTSWPRAGACSISRVRPPGLSACCVHAPYRYTTLRRRATTTLDPLFSRRQGINKKARKGREGRPTVYNVLGQRNDAIGSGSILVFVNDST